MLRIVDEIAKAVLPESVFSIIPAWVLTVIDIILVFIAARLIVLALNLLINRIMEARINSTDDMGRKRVLNTVGTVFKSIIKYVVYFLAIAAVVGILGLTSAMTSMLAAAGVGGLIISIGAQGVVKDIVTGIFMLFENQVAVGEYVTACDVTGIVTNVSFRTITIKGWRGELNIIPNGNIGIITNYSREPYLAVADIAVAYEVDVKKAMEIMLDEAKKLCNSSEGLLSEPSMLGINELAESGMTIRMTVNVRQYDGHWGIERKLKQNIKQRFDAEGIEIPYNKVVVIKGEEAASTLG
ncbi:MAG: mechanosensitive ion channel family protein [Clostridia bacterium]|nr:mechanosensitive ion channel family protein [Clostridia bacterium]